MMQPRTETSETNDNLTKNIEKNLESLNLSDDSELNNLSYPQAPAPLKCAHFEHMYFRPENKGPVKPKRSKRNLNQNISESFEPVQIDEHYRIDE